jgi:hypothetical protein
MGSTISKGGGNASVASRKIEEGRVSTVRWNPKGLRRSSGPESMGAIPTMNRSAKEGARSSRHYEHGVADRRVVRLIQKWLNAGVLEAPYHSDRNGSRTRTGGIAGVRSWKQRDHPSPASTSNTYLFDSLGREGIHVVHYPSPHALLLYKNIRIYV